MTQHSQTPWENYVIRVSGIGERSIFEHCICSGKDKIIARFLHQHAEAKEDAYFAVRAVNCHKYLVQMLEHVESCLKNEMPIDLDSIQQAIAKAEGK